MRKLIITLMLSLPMMAVAQDVITPEQQLEQAQKQLEEAKKALEQAKANAEKAKAEAEEAKRKAEEEAKRKAEEEAQRQQMEAERARLEEERAKLQEETERIKAETERLQAETEKIQAETGKIQEETAKIQEETVNIQEEPVKIQTKAEDSQTETIQQETPKTQEVSTTTVKSGWTAPTKEATKKVEKEKAATNKSGEVLKDDPKYMEDAVTLDENGKVEFVLDIDVDGKSADDIYEIAYDFLNALTQDEHQVDETSRIVLVNPQEHVIACLMKEWIVFQSSFISLDRTEFNYHLTATITDNHLNLVLNRIIYNYEEGRSTGFESPAEEIITDKYALNKKKTKLTPIYGKFRRGTINRKDEIFTNIADVLK